MLASFFARLLIVVDVIEVLEVLDVPELNVVVVRATGDKFTAIADVHCLDRQRMLSNNTENSSWDQMHRSNNTLKNGIRLKIDERILR